MGSKWLYCWYSRLFSKQCITFLCSFHLVFFSTHFVSIHVALTLLEKIPFIGSIRFHMINNLSIAVHTFSRHTFTTFSVDKILLLKYLNLSTNFRGLPVRWVKAPSYLKHINAILFVIVWRLMLPADCSRLCSRDLTCSGVFTRSTRSSAWSAYVMAFLQYTVCFLFYWCKAIFFYYFYQVYAAFKEIWC